MKVNKRSVFSTLSRFILYSSVLVFAAAIWDLRSNFRKNDTTEIIQVSDSVEFGSKENYIERIDFLGQKIPPFSLPFISGVDIYDFPTSLTSNYLLIVFFTPLDCPSCFTEIPFWNRLQDYKKNFELLGIVADDNSIIARKFIKQSDIQIPVLFDSVATYSRRIKLSRIGGTPIKILVNKEGHILHIKSSTYDQPILQNNYLKNLLSITGEYLSIQSR